MEQKFSLNATQLKFLAIFAMVLDHIGWAFFPIGSLPAFYLHLMGRLTFPIMAYFIAKGYDYTKNRKRYFYRLLLFALLSHIPFQFFNQGRINPFMFSPSLGILENLATSILFPFALAIPAIAMQDRWIENPLPNVFGIFLLFSLSASSDYMFYPILLTMLFHQAQGNRKQELFNGFFAIFLLVIPILQVDFLNQLYLLGTFFALVPISLYNGNQGLAKGPFFKYFFYWFYPLHLILLGLLRWGYLSF